MTNANNLWRAVIVAALVIALVLLLSGCAGEIRQLEGIAP
jgi:cytosine/uracil/thiamine/allantoin permease